MHLHSLPISLLSFPPFSHRALLQLTTLLLLYSLSFTISTNSQKTLLSLVHRRFSSSHHSQKTTFPSLSLNTLPLEPLPGSLSRQFPSWRRPLFAPLSHYWLSVHRPRKNTVQLEILSCSWKVVLGWSTTRTSCQMERSAAVCSSPL